MPDLIDAEGTFTEFTVDGGSAVGRWHATGDSTADCTLGLFDPAGSGNGQYDPQHVMTTWPSAEPGALRLGRVLRCSDKAELRERHLRLRTGPAQYEIGAVAKQKTDQDAVHRQRAMSEAPPDVQ